MTALSLPGHSIFLIAVCSGVGVLVARDQTLDQGAS